MKTIISIFIILLIVACGGKNTSVEGTYQGNGGTTITLKEGTLQLHPKGPFPGRSAQYKIVGDRIEYTMDIPRHFIINKDGTLVSDLTTVYKKQ